MAEQVERAHPDSPALRAWRHDQDRLGELLAADDVVTSPVIDGAHGLMRWFVKADPGMSVVRQRMTEPPPDNPSRMRAHPGHEWLEAV